MSFKVKKAMAREARRLSDAWYEQKGMDLTARTSPPTAVEQDKPPVTSFFTKSAQPKTTSLDESIFLERPSGEQYDPFKDIRSITSDNDSKPEHIYPVALVDFTDKVQELFGNTEEKRKLIAKRDIAGLNIDEWNKLRKLETAPMDKDLFRKVWRTVVAADLIPEGMEISSEEAKALSTLPRKAGKLEDDWAIPSPDMCAKILNVFSKIEPPKEVKPDPYAKLYETPQRADKGKPRSPYSFSSIYPS